MAMLATLCVLVVAVLVPAVVGTRSAASSLPTTLANATPDYMCTPESCGGKRDLGLYRKVMRFRQEFPGLLLTRCEIQKLNWCHKNSSRCPGGRFPEGREAVLSNAVCQSNVAPSEEIREQSLNVASNSENTVAAQGDGDRCCQTDSQVVVLQGAMTDHQGNSCHVLTLNDSTDVWYQFAHVGSCFENSSGNCDGQCHQVSRLVSLLCLEAVLGSPGSMRSVFRSFNLHAYCSCRSS